MMTTCKYGRPESGTRVPARGPAPTSRELRGGETFFGVHSESARGGAAAHENRVGDPMLIPDVQVGMCRERQSVREESSVWHVPAVLVGPTDRHPVQRAQMRCLSVCSYSFHSGVSLLWE